MSQYEDDADLFGETCENCGELMADCICTEEEREEAQWQMGYSIVRPKDGDPYYKIVNDADPATAIVTVLSSLSNAWYLICAAQMLLEANQPDCKPDKPNIARPIQ